jgi:hypothetical protein
MTDQSLIEQDVVPDSGRDVSAESADTCVGGVYGRCCQGMFGFARRLRPPSDATAEAFAGGLDEWLSGLPVPSDAVGETMRRTPGR